MTRKDYVMLAAVLHSVRPPPIPANLRSLGDVKANEVWEATVCAIALKLKKDNAAFDMPRFLSACGGYPPTTQAIPPGQAEDDT